MSVDAHQLERDALKRKDREQLVVIAETMGKKVPARARKDQIIALIVGEAETPVAAESPAAESPAATPLPFDGPRPSGEDRPAPAAVETAPPVAESSGPASTAVTSVPSAPVAVTVAPAAAPSSTSTFSPFDNMDAPAFRRTPPSSGIAPSGDGEVRAAAPAADGAGRPGGGAPAGADRFTGRAGADSEFDDGEGEGGEPGERIEGLGEREGGSRRRRRRGRDKDRDRPDRPAGAPVAAAAPGAPPDRDRDRDRDRERGDEGQGGTPSGSDSIAVSGHLDLRDEGYGFLRVKGYLPSREDVYVPAKFVRQFGLRKGDQLSGVSRPAGRGEKNPALLRVDEVNGLDPDAARSRPRFEDLTPLYPDSRLRLERADEPFNMTARIIDLVSPIGKGQRGLIVSPPKAGKTSVMKTIAQCIEANNPEVKLIVLLVDERPEEVTDMRRSVRGEVVASTFDRPADEHTHVAEMTIERAKRLVEQGEDVVVILDGITRLARAYNLAAPATGRIMSGGIDTGALYPPKKFFGAARNVEEGGSLTILATALVETGSRMDEVIFEEFKGTGNMELRLDRRLAEKRIFPAIDVDGSSTRHEELLFDRRQLNLVWKLRRVLNGLAGDGSGAAALELLVDRMRTFRSNDEFLAEIAKAPSM